MAVNQGFKGGVLAFGSEGAWGTADTRDNFIELNSESVNKAIERIESEALPQIYMREDESTQGNISVEGEFEFEVRWEGAELLFKHAMGSVSTAEVDSFAVTATNKYIEFKEDGGSQLTATLSEATYDIGISSAVDGSLCKEIKTQLEAAGTGTYTVTCPTATQKVTIAVAGGAAAVQILWKTGTVHGSDNADTHAGTLLGWDDSADTASASSVTADNAIVPVYDHTFSLADDSAGGLSFEVDMDNDAKLVEGGMIQTMGFTLEQGALLKCSMGIIGEDLTNPGSITSPTLTTTELVSFVEGAIAFGSSINVTSINFTLNNNWKTDRRFIGSRLISEPQRSGKIEVTGSFTMEYEDTTKFDDFVAGTSRSLTITCTDGTTIKTGFYRTLTITMAKAILTEATEKHSDHGIIMVECPFKAYATDGTTREFSMVLRNTTATIA